jgi:uncharacterized protein with FMN-binding domain
MSDELRKIILPLVVIAASGVYVWSQEGRIASENAAGANLTSLDASVSPDAPDALGDVAIAPKPKKLGQIAPTQPMPPVVQAVPSAATELPDTAAPASPPAAVLPVRPRKLPAQSEAAIAAAPTDTTASIDTVTPAPVAVAPVAVAPAPAARPSQLASAAVPQITLASSPVAPQQSGKYKNGTYKGPATDAYYGMVQVQANVANGQLASVKVLQYPNDRRTSRYINSQALPVLKQEAIVAQSGDVDFVSGATLTSQAFVHSLNQAMAQAKL